MFRSLSMLVPEPLAEDLSALLFERGADGVEIEDSTIRLMPGRPTLPEGKARLIGYFSPENIDPILAEVMTEAAGEAVTVDSQVIPDKDWNEVWMAHFAPIEVSERLWVCPSWRLGETPAGAKVLVLDPGMAFGTGTHATTSLCMRAVDRVLRERPGTDVLDVGTGSGILAIAAKLLGAGRVIGTDNDPVAIRVALENAALNKLELELKVSTLEGVGGPFPVVLANIMASTLTEIAGALAAVVAPGGELFLSGILDFQADDVERTYVGTGLKALGREAEGEWVLLHLGRAK